MKILLKLVCRDFLRHRSLLSFALLAIIATCGLIVWFVATIDLNAFADDNGRKDFFGTYTLAFCADRQLPYDLPETVHAMPEVARASFARLAPARLLLQNFDGALVPSGMGERRSPHLMGMADTDSPFELTDGRWFQNLGECVVGTPASDILCTVPGQSKPARAIAVGDTIRVTTAQGTETLTVVGTIAQKARAALTRNRASQTFTMGFGRGLGGGPSPNAAPPAGGPGGPGGPRGGRGPRSLFGAAASVTPDTPAVYVSLGDAIRLAETPGAENILFVQLRNPEQIDAFLQKLTKALGAPLEDLGVRIADTRPPKRDGQSLLAQGQTDEAIIGQAWSAIGIVILASVFIIFTTLSLGISEKTRMLAMLRTIGFTRRQVAAFVLLEGTVLGLLGWLGGILAGWLLLSLLLYAQNDVWPVVTLTPAALIFAFLCALLGAVGASIIPAWRATRIAPAEALPGRLHRFAPRRRLLLAICGLAFLALIPLLVFPTPFSIPTKLLLFSTLGTLFLGLGFLCCIPAAAALTETILGRAVAALLGFHHRFLAQILTGSQWRTIGTTVALSIGLGLYTAIYIWSFSMLAMFTVPQTIPDVLVRFQEAAISPEAATQLQNLPDLTPNHFLRVSVAQPDTSPDLSQRLLVRGAMAANIVCLGIDADKAWNPQDPLIRLRFVHGSPDDVRQAFNAPDNRVCVIPESLAVIANLRLGDSIPLKMALDGKRPVQQRRRPATDTPDDSADEEAAEPASYATYRIVGIVDFPWTWLSKCAGVRVSAGRTSALILTPYQPLIQDFAALDNEFFWLDKAPSLSHAELTSRVQAIATDSYRRQEERRRELARTNPLLRLKNRPADSYSGGTLWDPGLNRNHVMVSSNESLNNSLNIRSYSIIDTMAQMPIIILILSSLAIVNTMVVSVRSRRWELGVLRACGVSRTGIMRVILAEALLIGLCSCLVSFAFGLFYSWLATQLVDLAPVFGVTAPPLTIPWTRLLPGYALTLALAALAGLAPALLIGFRDISSLLQRRD